MGTMYIDITPNPANFSIMEEVIRKKFEIIRSKRQLKCALAKTKVYEGKMKNGYRRIHFHESYGRYIAVLTNPCFGTMTPYRLVFHFSQWKSLDELFRRIRSLFGMELGDEIINEAELARIDVWVDVPVSYQVAKKCVYKPKISVSEQYKGVRGTTYLGSRKSECYDLIYDKTDPEDLFQQNPVTRFERVLKGSEIPIRSLCHYPILAEMELFSTMHFDIPEAGIFNCLNDSEIHPAIKDFLKIFQSEGLHMARKRLSRNRAYYTKVLPFWEANSKRFDLSGEWKRYVNRVILKKDKPRKNFLTGCEILPAELDPILEPIKWDEEELINDEVDIPDDEFELEDDETDMNLRSPEITNEY